MGDRPYPWIVQSLPGVEPAPPVVHPDEVTCPNCRCTWLRERKKCPACYVRLDQHPAMAG